MGPMVPMPPPARRQLAIAIGAPLALLTAVYGLWAAIDAVGQVGPFDKARLGWAIVKPLWFASPALAATLWHRLPLVDRRLVATAIGLALTATATGILWSRLPARTPRASSDPEAHREISSSQRRSSASSSAVAGRSAR